MINRLFLTVLGLVLELSSNAAAAEHPAEYARATSVIETNIDGEFEGCDFDRLLPLANGLIFRCAEYNYVYAYRPKVQIIMLQHGPAIVTIGGRTYRGSFVRVGEQ